MLVELEFKDDRFCTKDYCNVLTDLTKNTIILCNNCKIMDSLAREILDTVNGEAEYNDYVCDDEDVGAAKMELRFGLQRVIDINGQKITLALEPSIIYKADNPEDIWFFDCHNLGEDKENPYQEFLYPFTAFIGAKETWDIGKDKIYKNVCNGCYGTFDGNWVNLSAVKKEWIPIDEQMPDKNSKTGVWLTLERDGHRQVVHGLWVYNYFEHRNGTVIHPKEIVAWMPFEYPAPYAAMMEKEVNIYER